MITAFNKTRSFITCAAASLAALCLSACASLSVPPETSANLENRVSPQNLEAGECALFVWTADNERRFVLFAQSQNSSAIWASKSGETSLVTQSQSGEAAQLQFPQQTYDGLSLDLRNPQAIENGTRYKSGTLTENTSSDWTRVIPVVGLSVCKEQG